MKKYMIFWLIALFGNVQSRQFDRSEDQDVVTAQSELLEVCKKHQKNHLKPYLLKNRRPTKSHSVQQLLNKEYAEELSLVDCSDIVQFCQKYNR